MEYINEFLLALENNFYIAQVVSINFYNLLHQEATKWEFTKVTSPKLTPSQSCWLYVYY